MVKKLKRQRTVPCLMLLQIVILLLFLLAIYESMPITVNDCTEVLIFIEDKEYVPVYREYRCRIYSNNVRYDFPNSGVFSEHTSKELYEIIQLGDNLSIKYIKRYGFFGKYNLIVDARNEENVYVDVNLYNDQKSIVPVIVIFIIIELSFLLYGFMAYKKSKT